MSKRKSQTYHGVKLRPRGQSWQVDFGTSNGTRNQKSFTTLEEAKIAVRDFIVEHTEQTRLRRIDEKNKRIGLYDLTDVERLDVMTAFDRLQHHASLTEAVEFYLEHNKPEGGTCTVTALIDQYAEAKRKANRREKTLIDIRSRLGRLAVDYGDRPVHEVTAPMLERWMDKHDYRGVTRDNYRRHFVGFFNFAVKRGYAKINPAKQIEVVSIDEKIPEILTVDQVRKILRAAETHAMEMVPYFAIGFFAGLHPNEIEHLDWQEIDLGRGRIVLRPEVAKRRRQRYVDISDNLVRWLSPHRREKGRIYFSRRQFEKVRGKAKVRWPHDVMRHCFGSYHLARQEDAGKTALQMGHINTVILFNHYRDLVDREDASQYWDLLPRETPSVIEFGIKDQATSTGA